MSVRDELQSVGRSADGSDALTTDQPLRIAKAGADVIRFEPVIGGEDGLDAVARSEHREYVLDG